MNIGQDAPVSLQQQINLPNTIIGRPILSIMKTGSTITITELFICSSTNLFATKGTMFFLHRLDIQKGSNDAQNNQHM